MWRSSNAAADGRQFTNCVALPPVASLTARKLETRDLRVRDEFAQPLAFLLRVYGYLTRNVRQFTDPSGRAAAVVAGAGGCRGFLPRPPSFLDRARGGPAHWFF